MNHIRIVSLLTLFCTPIFGSFPSRVDPYPLYTAANMLGNYTSFGQCEPEYHVRLSVTPFRQNAYKAYRYNDHNTPVVWSPSIDTIDKNECEIGNIYGNWNYLGIFYTQAVREKFPYSDGATEPVDPLGIQWDDESTIEKSELRATLSNPNYTDPAQLLGFMSVPMEFRSYGVRLQGDFITPIGVGISGKISIGQRQQTPTFTDKTASATIGTDDKGALSNLIFQKLNPITERLDLGIRPYCENTIDQGIFSLFFTKNFDCFIDEDSPYSSFVCSPFFAVEWEPALHEINPNNLIAANVGTNGHTGYGFHAGVTINFLDTIEIGCDIAPTYFTSRTYQQAPMPTHEKQIALFPTKADYTLEPGTNWTFGASMAAFDFTKLFSASCEFRYVHHCKDRITLISPASFKDKLYLSDSKDENKEIISYLRPNVLEDRSGWSSCFINLATTLSICSGFQLGCACQIPVRMRNAYYSTTILGSLSVQY